MKTFLREFWLFGIKQASASIFGGYLLFLILLTKFWYPFETLYRNDFLFLAALGFQLTLLVLRLESPREAAVILIFHVVATAMEVFKTSDAIGAWHYPGEFRNRQRAAVRRLHVQRGRQLYRSSLADL